MDRVMPILFNTGMTEAILGGRKTVTRRAVRYKYGNTEIKMKRDKYGAGLIEIQKDVEGETHGKNPDGSTWHKLRPYIEKRPPYRPGDILYVRETWGFVPCIKCNMGELISRRCGEDPIEYGDGGSMSEGCFVYKAGHTEPRRIRWRPSIHMPRLAARIWLRVTDVRAERLQEIDGWGVSAEGVDNGKSNPANGKRWENMQRMVFSELWNSTIKKKDICIYGWIANPWVWVIEFEPCEKPGV